ncbi:hypothetical protein H4Q26_013302 [Puccinia striiformis f. sp. tritici PST-130]|nr:hypothetical protein H4Q26_013302 [Puccinia striiformis f. sp. tritici PST-130]
MNNQPPRNNIPDDPLRIRQRRTVSAAGQFNLDPVPAANPPVRPANTAARFNPDINPPVRQIPILLPEMIDIEPMPRLIAMPPPSSTPPSVKFATVIASAQTVNDNPTFERIVRSILINSLHESMRRHMGRLETARAMFVDLRARFHTISRAAQMNAFNNLLDFNATNFASTAEMAAHIEDALDEMEDV